MDRKISKIASIIFSPPVILLPTPFILILRQTNDISLSFKWGVFSAFFLLLTILFLIYGEYEGIFSNFDISIKEERAKFFLGGGIITFLYFFLTFFLKAPEILFALSFGIMLGTLVLFVVNNFIKASIHTATLSAFSISVILLFGIRFSPLLLLIPFMAWARVVIKKHTISEVIMGGFLGSILTILIYIMGKIIA